MCSEVRNKMSHEGGICTGKVAILLVDSVYVGSWSFGPEDTAQLRVLKLQVGKPVAFAIYLPLFISTISSYMAQIKNCSLPHIAVHCCSAG